MRTDRSLAEIQEETERHRRARYRYEGMMIMLWVFTVALGIVIWVRG